MKIARNALGRYDLQEIQDAGFKKQNKMVHGIAAYSKIWGVIASCFGFAIKTKDVSGSTVYLIKASALKYLKRTGKEHLQGTSSAQILNALKTLLARRNLYPDNNWNAERPPLFPPLEIDAKLRDDPDHMFTLIQKERLWPNRQNLFASLSEKLQNDHGFIKRVVIENQLNLELTGDRWKNDKDFILEIIREGGINFNAGQWRNMADIHGEEIFFQAIKINPEVYDKLRPATSRIFAPDFTIKALQANPLVKNYLSPDMSRDPEVIKHIHSQEH